ncbi:MAG: glutathione S-transferase family protein [Geminicoccaceae bacterium]
MLEIWGRPYSSNVIPVIWTAAELGLDFRLNLSGGSFGVLGTEEYEKLNPNRLIPTIRDNGFVLWESHAIIRYLADRYGQGTLCPRDAQTRGNADQWMEWCGTRAFPAVFQLFWDTVRTEPEKRDMADVAKKAEAAGRLLTILDAHLANHAYVAGEAFTMGDIPLGAVAYRYFNVAVERPSLPYMEAWYARLSERPAYQKHVMRFFGTNPSEWREIERHSGEEWSG